MYAKLEHLCQDAIIPCICSAQSDNLRNLEIALRILRTPRLRTIVARSQDCALHLCNLEIAQL